MRHFIEELIAGSRLKRAEAEALMEGLVESNSVEQQAAILSLLQARSLSLEELQGFSDCLLKKAVSHDLGSDLMDVCGTGGDNKDTFNISTTSAFVVAGAGVRVAKHGNYGSSSKCGSSSLIEGLGIPLTNDKSLLERSLERANFCYLHAPLFHPSLKAISSVRKALGIRTVFNVLGPLLNPVRPAYRLVGVAKPELLRLFTYYLSTTGGRFAVVHSRDGYDEVSLTESTDIFQKGSSRSVTPEKLGMMKVSPRDLESSSSEQSIAITLKILRGEGTKPQEGVVLANAAVALEVALGKPLIECVELAKESLHSGRAMKCIETLQTIS